MGVHGRNSVNKKSAKSLNDFRNHNKKSTEVIDSTTKSTSEKSSTSLLDAGKQKTTNESESVDANMAPALTEPLSPKEELSKTRSTTIAGTDNTEEEKEKLESVPITSSSSLPSSSSPPSADNNIHRVEKRISQRPTKASSTKVIRSKDSPIDAFTELIPEISDNLLKTAQTILQDYFDKPENEQMGLSAATPPKSSSSLLEEEQQTSSSTKIKITTAADSPINNNIDSNNTNSNTTTATNNNNNNNIACKDNSTEQLLADLTNDLEGTITAEISLRKQLPEVKVSTPDAAQLSSSETETEILTIEGIICKDIPDTVVETKLQPTHMESAFKKDSEDDSTKNDNSITLTSAESTDELTLKFSDDDEDEDNEEKQKEIINSNVKDEKIVANTSDVTPAAESSICIESEPVVPVADLPPINSDSTMTASEEESEDLDALEARLSQLDGIAVTPNTVGDDTNNAIVTSNTTFSSSATNENAMVTTTATTPPRTPSQQQETSSNLSAPVQQQLLLTPNSTSSQMLALTPQSSSSLMREGNASNAGGELEDQELEEVFKVLKGFDANAPGADNVLCDLNVLFSEVYTNLNYDDIGCSTQPQQQHHLHQQQNLMTPYANASSIISAKVQTVVSPLKEMQADINKQQQSMQRKTELLMRRLRKLQVRYMSKHTTEEIAGLFELIARLTNKGASSGGDDVLTSSNNSLTQSVISSRPPVQSWEEDIKNVIPVSQMGNILHRLETSANAQQFCTTSSSMGSPSYSAPTLSSMQHQRKSKKLGDATSTTASATTIAASEVDNSHKNDEVIPTLSTQVVDELTHVAGMLRAEMRDIQTAYDSDATESSSGAESADEMVAYNNQVQQSLSIVKRAAWRYSRERAAIAARWSWLLSQIADLEIKIRQHSELYQEVVRTKGPVVCEEELAKSTSVASTTTRGTLNPYEDDNEENALPGSCRTRGYVPGHFRKRKLLQTTHLHTISKKAARPSTIKCGCQWPLNPCALCTGRTDPTAPRDLPDTMMLPDRIALLDPGFHPVLSFTEDVNNSIHFEAIARTPSWQQRIIRIQPKSIARSVWKAEREAANSSGNLSSRKYGDVMMPTQKRKYVRRKDRNASGATANTSTGSIDGTSLKIDADITTMPLQSSSTTIGTTSTTKLNVTSSSALSSSLGTTTLGNGTSTTSFTSTTSTTPFEANKLLSATTRQTAPSTKKMLVGDCVLMDPSSSNNNQMNDCQMSQNCDQFNPNPVHSSLISNHNQHNSSSNNSRKGKQRKSVPTANQHNSYYNQQPQQNHPNNINNTQYQQNYTNGDINFDYWDTSGRSRTASPTHGIGGSSSYHKYERSLERRNRISYDIDNIVIPYSVAAATRVEILPYKEIPTPKWRLFDEENPVVDTEDKNMEIIKEEKSTDIAKVSPGDRSQVISDEVKVENKPPVANDVGVIPSADDDKTKGDDGTKAELEEIQKDKEEKRPVTTSTSTNAENCDIPHCRDGDAPEPPVKKLKIEDTTNCNNNSDADRSISSPSPMAKSNEFKESTSMHDMSMGDDSNDRGGTPLTANDLDEDISDKSFVLRHERALNEERKKFQTFLKFPWSTRSRANRRIDSRAESSGANTPDPASPAPNTPSLGGGDQDSIPSPLAPSTPLTPLDTINEALESGLASTSVTSAHSSSTIAPPAFPINPIAGYGSSKQRNERRRTTSVKNQHLERNERRSLTPDSREVTIPPFEPLTFPLNEDEFNLLSSVTLLPPSASSNASYKNQDDYDGSGGVGGNNSWNHTKSTVSRNSRRGSLKNAEQSGHRIAAITATGMNYDVNGKRPRLRKFKSLNARTTSTSSGSLSVDKKASIPTATHPYINGKNIDSIVCANSDAAAAVSVIPTTHSTDNDDDMIDEEMDDVDYFDDIDGDDDGYSKHPLAPGNEDIEGGYVDDDEYNAYVGGGNSNSLLGVSDTDTSDADPFEDDDPNDPEWKGEPRTERPERIRKRS